ncbi:MAG: EamA family transporter [Desulforegulaceae bacterium]|nr:EamA family transporter [Desulforegulaceae bacterium]
MSENNKDINEVLKGRVLIVAAAILWGTSGAAQAYAPIEASPALLGTFRILIAGIFITSFSVIKNQIKNFRCFFTPFLLLTGLCQAMFQFGYFSAIKITGVAVGAMVAIGCSPVFSGILGVLFDREKLSINWFISTFLAVSGLFLLMISSNDSVKIETAGILFAILAGFSYALFTLVAKRLIKSRSEDSVIGVSFLIGTVFMAFFFFIYPINWLFTPRGIGAVLYLGIISAGLSYMCYGRGLKSVKVSTVGTLTLAEPLTAAFLGIFLLNEPLTFLSGIGMIFILVSQVIMVFNK